MPQPVTLSGLKSTIEDTHDENISAFPTLTLQKETSMTETSETSSKIILTYQKRTL